MTVYSAEVEVEVEVTINDQDVIDRCVNNHNDSGEPVPYGQDQGGFRDLYYDLGSEQEVINHLVYNCIANGKENLQNLEGWADLPENSATMRIKYVEFD